MPGSVVSMGDSSAGGVGSGVAAGAVGSGVLAAGSAAGSGSLAGGAGGGSGVLAAGSGATFALIASSLFCASSRRCSARRTDLMPPESTASCRSISASSRARWALSSSLSSSATRGGRGSGSGGFVSGCLVGSGGAAVGFALSAGAGAGGGAAGAGAGGGGGAFFPVTLAAGSPMISCRSLAILTRSESDTRGSSLTSKAARDGTSMPAIMAARSGYLSAQAARPSGLVAIFAAC